MARHRFSTSTGYLQVLRGLHRLHDFALTEQNDSPEADAIRDGIDQHWYNLSETEQDRLNGLSEDLYSISDPTKGPLATNPQVQRKLAEVNEARQAGKWDQALDLLRRWGRYLDPALLSFARGEVWHEAGDDATANMFYEHAARLAPLYYQNIYLYRLWETDADRARKLAGDVLASGNSYPPEVVVTAAHIRFTTIRGSIVAESHSIIEGMIFALKQALVRIESGENPNLFLLPDDEIRVSVTLLLAGCYERLGDLRTAIRYLNEGISANPDDVSSLVIRGILRYGIEPGATDDLKRAADLGSSLPWPGFYLAHHALVEGRYQDCLKMCERGLSAPAPDEVRANLQEWLAISRAELGYPPDQVRSAFEEAVGLAPDADHIRNNFATFEEALDNPTGPRPEWIKPKALTVQAFGRSEYLPPIRPIPVAA